MVYEEDDKLDLDRLMNTVLHEICRCTSLTNLDLAADVMSRWKGLPASLQYLHSLVQRGFKKASANGTTGSPESVYLYSLPICEHAAAFEGVPCP